MKQLYLVYALTMLSAVIVWYMFGVFAVVAAGYTWLPISAFIASIIHFGISSWLFLWKPKAGRIVAITTAAILCIWPVAALVPTIRREMFSLFFFGVPILFSTYVIAKHINAYGVYAKISKNKKVALSVIPAVMFVAYVIYLLRIFR